MIGAHAQAHTQKCCAPLVQGRKNIRLMREPDAGWLDGWLAGWLPACWFAGWLAGLTDLAGWLAGCLGQRSGLDG